MEVNMTHKILLAALLVSCGGTDEPTPSNTDTDDQVGTAPAITSVWTVEDLAGSCDSSVRVGGFEVAHWPGSDIDEPFATVTGTISEGVTPSTVYFPRETVGDCTLLQRENPFCDPPCAALEVCTHEQTCEPFPENQDAGTVFVAGLEVDVALNPDATNYYWDTSVPYPLFAPSDGVLLENTGGAIGAFSLRGLGVAKMELLDDEWTIVRGESLDMAWTPGGGNGRVVAAINVDQHGTSPVTLTCTTPDDGELTIDGGLLEQLLQYGVSGFATGTVRRQSGDKVDLDSGCVDLRVYSHSEAAVSVDGHTPCVRDEDCPDGERCEVVINTCVPI
jgi:hypothetical protein